MRDRMYHNCTSHPVVQRSLKTFLVHIQIRYIHCIYIYTLYIHICVRTPTLHECSLALAELRSAALARSLSSNANYDDVGTFVFRSKMPPPKNGVYIVQGEIALVVTAMRRNTRWTSHNHQVKLYTYPDSPALIDKSM